VQPAGSTARRAGRGGMPQGRTDRVSHHAGAAVRIDMSFCEHCQGQRFDRAQVLRALRETRKRLRSAPDARHVDAVMAAAIEAVRSLEIPHLEPFDEVVDGEVIH
jgi:hypothetical protein